MIAHPKRSRLTVVLGGGWHDVLPKPPDGVGLISTIAQSDALYALGIRYGSGEPVVFDATGAPVALPESRLQAAINGAFRRSRGGA